MHGAYEEELKRRRQEAEKIEWVNVDDKLMETLKVGGGGGLVAADACARSRKCFGL